MLRRVGQLLRRCHDAGCRGIAAENLLIETNIRSRLRLVPSGNLFNAPPTERASAADLKALIHGLGLSRRQDVARIMRGYFGSDTINTAILRITAATLRLAARRAA